MADEENSDAPVKVAERLFNVLQRDLRNRLDTIDRYLHGDHPEPYMPDTADAEFKMLAKRSVTNHCPLLVDTPAQSIFVDGFRRGGKEAKDKKRVSKDRLNLPEWIHWQDSRLDSRQDAVHRGALAYGHSFTVTEFDEDEGKVLTRGLSPLRTTALYEDPANDDNPVAALFVHRYPMRVQEDLLEEGVAFLWDRTNKYTLRFGNEDWRIESTESHNLEGECPVTRFAAAVDLDGRTVGVIEPYLRIQDRINQTVFDLLVAQTGESFETRWVTGMAPPTLKKNIGTPEAPEWVEDLDENGQPKVAPINIHARKFLMAEDHETRFGSLPGTPLAPYVEAVDLAVRHLSALSQTPPHYLLGQIANLSAEALNAAEGALTRKVHHFKTVFGESWERVFRLALRLSGDSGFEDMTGEVLWRDMETYSISQVADALGKMRTNLNIPARGLWARIPGVTEVELAQWEDLYEEEETELGLMRSAGGKPAAPGAPEDQEVANGDEEGEGG